MAQTANGEWSSAVPLEETDGNARPRARRNNTQGSQDREARTMKSGTRRPPDHGGIQSDSEETRQRRKNVKAVNNGATRKRSRNALWETAARDRDDSAWIHRDKLAQIEIQEMVDAGIPVRMSRRSLSLGPETGVRSSRSLSRSRKSLSKDQLPDDSVDHHYDGDSDHDNGFGRKRISTIDQGDEEEHAYDPRIDGNDRNLPDASSPRDGVFSSSPTHHARPSTSRIPVSLASPVPVPQNVVGRDSPLPRSRHGSQAPSGNWEELMYARRPRTSSMGSQVLLDDEGATPTRPGSSYKTANNHSPPKNRTKSGGTQAHGRRKSSSTNLRPGSSAGKKTPSSSTTQRSTSRSNRPLSTHHPPEGDPPWLTDMYKPDPRLPPDQQMLPTHARRLAQEQWEKEGKFGTSYDRDLRQLNDTDFPPAPEPSKTDIFPSTITNPPSEPHDRISPPVPHLSPVPDRAEAGSPTRSVTSGGYRITPTISAAPPIQRSPTAPSYSQPGNMTAELRRPNQDFNEKNPERDAEASKGGCACCVVM